MQRTRFRTSSGLVALCLALFAAPTIRAADAFVRAARGSVVLASEADRQTLTLIGPDAAAAEWPELDPQARTLVVMRCVPSGGAALNRATTSAHVTAVVVSGVGLGDDDLKQLIADCPDLRTVHLHAAGSLPADEIADLTDSEKAALAAPTVSGKALKAIGDLRSLRYLELDGYPLPEDRLAFLAKSTSLEQLSLRTSELVDDDLRALSELSNLAKLQFANCEKITGQGLTHLHSCRRLSWIDLSRTAADDELSKVFADTPWRIGTLKIGGSKLTTSGTEALEAVLPFAKICAGDDGTKPLVPPVRTDTQSIREYRVACHLLDRFSKLCIEDGSVRGLELVSDEAGPSLLPYVSMLQDLQQLSLEGWEFRGDALAALSSLRGLKELSLKRARMTDESLSSLVPLDGLEKIILEDVPISDAGVEHLSKMTSLKAIQLENTRITDRGVQLLARLPQLVQIGLANCDITDEGAKHLLKSPSLRRFDLEATLVSDRMVRELYRHASKNETTEQAEP